MKSHLSMLSLSCCAAGVLTTFKMSKWCGMSVGS
jgi:hypothetical protein